MKRPIYLVITALSLLLFLSSALFAQSQSNSAYIKKAGELHSVGPLKHQIEPQVQHQAPSSQPIPIQNSGSGGSAGKVAAVVPVGMGRASNIYSSINEHQNQVVANDSLNLVAFIHRQDVTVFGGGTAANGRLRYDLSLDGGATFTSDIGMLNNTYTYPARYPNMALYNMSGTTNPLNGRFGYIAATVNNGTWNGHVTGSSTITTTTPTATETYHSNANYLMPSSITERVPGEFWAIAPGYNGTNFTSSIFVFKGVYNSTTQDIDWATPTTILVTHDITYDGTIHMIHPQISFSPDGTTGWIGFLGDIPGGPQHVFSPVFIKSANGGTTWGTPTEVNLNAQSFVSDSLQSLWITTNPQVPASTGMATGTFEFDLTVDANGNPHMFSIIGSAQSQDSSGTPTGPPSYTVYSGLAKFAADIHSDNGGTSFSLDYVAPILTFRGEFGTPDPTTGDLISMDNFPQISRTEDGNYIFYSWADADTVIIGFGETTNLAPNLRIAGHCVPNNERTCYKLVSDGDFIWDGRIMFPTMAPTVLTSGSTFELPIVVVEMILNDQLAPCRYHYFGNDCTFDTLEFQPQATLGLAWGPDA